METSGKVRTPLTQGDEVEVASRLYDKYARLASEYYGKEVGADNIRDGKTYENLGEE